MESIIKGLENQGYHFCGIVYEWMSGHGYNQEAVFQHKKSNDIIKLTISETTKDNLREEGYYVDELEFI